jgi:hypothetical protein
MTAETTTQNGYGQYGGPRQRAEAPSAGPAPYSLAALEAGELDTAGARIRFGDRPNQTMPASWAADVLTKLADRHPAQFGQLLTEAATGIAPPPRRGRKPAEGADSDHADE